MFFLFNSDVFVLGFAVGVLGLIVLFSVLVSLAYNERTLQLLATYVVGMVLILMIGQWQGMNMPLIERLLLVVGPMLVGGMQMWLFRRRTVVALDIAITGVLLATALALMGFMVADSAGWMGTGDHRVLTRGLCAGWGALLFANLAYRGLQARETAGPWKWWQMAGHAAGLLVALLFLTDYLEIRRAYWSVALMLLVQAPPVYLGLVWRSRLLNEIRLRSETAGVTDPLTGLATAPVLVERIMRVMSRAHTKNTPSGSALLLIEVQNWHGLLLELGQDFNEKLLLDAALRLRRGVADNDLVARISHGRFSVLAQGLTSQHEVTSLATRLVVSGLRIDSPLLPGVELKFRVIVNDLKVSTPLTLTATNAWLDGLANNFKAWPSTHRSRSILVVTDESDNAEPFKADSSY